MFAPPTPLIRPEPVPTPPARINSSLQIRDLLNASEEDSRNVEDNQAQNWFGTDADATDEEGEEPEAPAERRYSGYREDYFPQVDAYGRPMQSPYMSRQPYYTESWTQDSQRYQMPYSASQSRQSYTSYPGYSPPVPFYPPRDSYRDQPRDYREPSLPDRGPRYFADRFGPDNSYGRVMPEYDLSLPPGPPQSQQPYRYPQPPSQPGRSDR